MADERPAAREDPETAIICALPLEASAVNYLFDEFWDDRRDRFYKAPRDENHYSTGRIGKHHVVLVQLPGMGKANAATAATFLLSSYTRVRLALVVGVRGGVPTLGKDDDENEILLGDVIISNAVVQYDLGQHYPHRFFTKTSIEDSLNKTNKDVCALLRSLTTDHGTHPIQEKTARFLRELQDAHTTGLLTRRAKERAKYQFPGTARDKLFSAKYQHRHYNSSTAEPCGCSDNYCCPLATASFCEDVGCNDSHLVTPRERLAFKHAQEAAGLDCAQNPCVYIGTFASGDNVMKSAAERDRIAKEQNVIAFEMEGAGVWDIMPCIIVKGVGDYADSHKSRRWQNFAAAAAAAATKALLETFDIKGPNHTPPGRERGFDN
ncbi:nucleoside phosphorylase domain-containing protein [Podospora didyma]|uniref:Nucleoside phosphorylase domain-containing protein n=1 Tax=Podospora didyma TaxID=330526 RepID=A0AAE0U777_9PEZI|nr:nucleoside phosphorylase domain-containing protein [Podospora didyma]